MRNTLFNRSIFAIVLLTSLLSLPSFQSSAQKTKKKSPIKTIVIDPGHGGRAPGAHGLFSSEKNVALSVSLKLGEMIKENMPDVKVIFTRTTDIDVPLYKRVEIANTNKANLFISIHCNSMPDIKEITGYKKGKGGKKVPIYKMVPDRSTFGSETLIAGPKHADNEEAALRENADMLLEKNYKDNYEGFDPKDPESYIIFSLMKNKYREKSSQIAQLIQNKYIANGRASRGVKEQRVYILQRVGMPSFLTEIGFISNVKEEKYINSENGQQQIVKAIYNAVKAYKNKL